MALIGKLELGTGKARVLAGDARAWVGKARVRGKRSVQLYTIPRSLASRNYTSFEFRVRVQCCTDCRGYKQLQRSNVALL